MSDITTARPYAQAAFEEAHKLNALKTWSEMLIALAEVVSNKDVHSLAVNPKVSKQQLALFLEAVLEKTATMQQRNFVRILVENQRILLLPEIAAIFEVLKAEAEKTINVVVDSAYELTAGQQEKLISSLKRRLGREVKLACNVKKELLGGIVVRAGDKVIDGTAIARLSEMATALA